MRTKKSSLDAVIDKAMEIFQKQKEELQKQLEEAKYNKSMSISAPETLAYATEIAVLNKKLNSLQKDIDSFLKTTDRIIRQEKTTKSKTITSELEVIVLPSKKVSPLYDDTLRLVATIPPYEKHLFEKAINEYGDKYLVIRDNVLYCKGYKDLSGFWKLVRKLQAEFDNYTAAIANFFNTEKEAIEKFEADVQEGYQYEIAISDGTTERYYDKLTTNNVALAVSSGKGYIAGYESMDGHPTGHHRFVIDSDILTGEFLDGNYESPIADIVEAYKNARQLEEEQNVPEYE